MNSTVCRLSVPDYIDANKRRQILTQTYDLIGEWVDQYYDTIPSELFAEIREWVETSVPVEPGVTDRLLRALEKNTIKRSGKLMELLGPDAQRNTVNSKKSTLRVSLSVPPSSSYSLLSPTIVDKTAKRPNSIRSIGLEGYCGTSHNIIIRNVSENRGIHSLPLIFALQMAWHLIPPSFPN